VGERERERDPRGRRGAGPPWPMREKERERRPEGREKKGER
jgi:hypothetical protein